MADHPESRLERATESTLAKAFARFAVPILLTIIGWFLITGIGDLKTDVRSQGTDIVIIKSDLRDVNTRLDSQVLRQVETNSKAIEKLDERLGRIERRLGEP